jgi:hypothetical protein
MDNPGSGQKLMTRAAEKIVSVFSNSKSASGTPGVSPGTEIDGPVVVDHRLAHLERQLAVRLVTVTQPRAVGRVFEVVVDPHLRGELRGRADDVLVADESAHPPKLMLLPPPVGSSCV